MYLESHCRRQPSNDRASTMSAITFMFKCARCHADFRAPGLSDFSYGLFVMKTESADDAAFLDAQSDNAFLESCDLVQQNKLVANLTGRKLSRLQQAVFTTTCDPGPHGDAFRIGLRPKCPTCGFRDMESWEPVRPIQEWPLPVVEHQAWNAKTLSEKIEVIDRAVEDHLANN